MMLQKSLFAAQKDRAIIFLILNVEKIENLSYLKNKIKYFSKMLKKLHCWTIEIHQRTDGELSTILGASENT